MATPLGTLTLDLIAKTGGFTEPMKKAGDTAERESKRIEKSTGSALEMIKGLGATALAGFTVGTVISIADEYSQMAAQIRNATSSQQEYDQVQKHLLETANTTYRSLKEAQQVYLDVGGALKAYGETTERSLRITDSLSFSFTHNATAADKAASATDAYMKSIYSGKVSGDAWISILSAIPSIVADLSKKLNKSEADILSLGNAGKLSTKDLNNALDASREKSEALANNMSNSLPDGLSNARNGFLVLAGTINETYGVTNTMAAGLGVIGDTAKLAADNLDVLGNVTAVAGAYLVGSYIPAIALGAKSLATDTAAKVSNVMATRAKTLADYEIAKSNLAATAAMVKSMGPINAQTAAMMANARASYQQAAAAKASMLSLRGALLGPVGLGIAVAGVAAGYLLMKDNAEKATASIDTQGKSVSELVVKYRELNTLQRDNEAKALADQIEDLGLKYRVASSDLYSFMEALPVSDEKIATFSKLNSELSQGRMTSDEYYQAVKNVNILTDDQLNKVRGLLGGYVEAKSKFKDAESAQNAFKTALSGVTGEVKKQAGEVAVLSEELKKLLEDNSVVAYKNNLVGSIVSSTKVDPKLAEYIYEMRKAAGILGTSKSLTEDQIKSVRERWQSEKNLNKTIDERNKLEEKNKKLVEAQGNAMKVNALVASNAAKYNFKGIEAKNGLPSGLLSAVHMQESRGNANAYNKSSGAAGGFQFLSATAKQYGVSDRYNLAQAAEGAGKYLAHLLSLFNGDIEKAISAYHAGEGNVQRGTNIGPINRQYVKNVKGYMGGASGASFTEDYSFDDWVQEQEKIIIERERIAEKQKQLNIEVADDAVRIKQQLADKFEEIDKAGFSDTKASELKAQYQKRADIEIQVAQAAQADKLSAYSDYMKSEEQLINESYARRQRDLKLDIQLTTDQYAEASLHLEKQRQQELQRARWHALELRQTLEDSIISLSGGADDIFAKSTMTPQEYSQWSLESDRSKAQVALKNDRVNVERDIMTSDTYTTDDERYEALLQAHQEYRDGLYAIDLQYDQSVKDLAQSQMLQQLEMWQGIFSSGQTTFAQLTQSVKNNAGEQSTAYRIAFAGQQSFSIASSLVAAWTAYTQAFADPSAMTLPQKFAGGTAVMGALMPAIATISSIGIDGMAHNGIDNIPKEGTWLLDGGERVLNPQQNKDLTNYLANKPNHQQSQPIENSLRVIMVKDEDEAKDMLYSADGEKAFLYHMKRTGYAKR
ncbi:tape measure protein [Acinetobacter sp. TUM15064]|uniref:tape measure protein n=1 Tax=Acinetobacter sp. TUM15064 TaxID=2609134 RepID=UPI00148F065F|nr:tape measure protein [Acinetobacter sp. TUM15064]